MLDSLARGLPTELGMFFSSSYFLEMTSVRVVLVQSPALKRNQLFMEQMKDLVSRIVILCFTIVQPDARRFFAVCFLSY